MGEGGIGGIEGIEGLEPGDPCAAFTGYGCAKIVLSPGDDLKMPFAAGHMLPFVPDPLPFRAGPSASRHHPPCGAGSRAAERNASHRFPCAAGRWRTYMGQRRDLRASRKDRSCPNEGHGRAATDKHGR